MNWSDYEAVWKRQTPPVGASADVAVLKESFEAQSRKMAAALQVRDFAESSAGLLVIAAYGYFWWEAGSAGWPLAFGIILILFVIGVFMRERLRARSRRVNPDAPLVIKVEGDLTELRYQRRLILTVWAWYIAPCAGAMAAQFVVIYRRSKPWEAIREPVFLLGCVAFVVLICALVWVINRRAVRNRIEPRIAELEKLLRELQSLS